MYIEKGIDNKGHYNEIGCGKPSRTNKVNMWTKLESITK